MPRVFARECIGLKTAGYRPFITEQSLIFHGAPTPMTFERYLEQVNLAGLTANNQEQVMAIAQRVAGFSLGEADILRRAMGKKKKSELD